VDQQAWDTFLDATAFQYWSAKGDPALTSRFEAYLNRAKQSQASERRAALLYLAVWPDAAESLLSQLLPVFGPPAAPAAALPFKFMLEKPVGHDLASAQRLIDKLRSFLGNAPQSAGTPGDAAAARTAEALTHAVCWVDHYLAKPGVALALAAGHALSSEPSPDVAAVELSLLESAPVAAERAAAYNAFGGAVRDMLQSHGSILLATASVVLTESYKTSTGTRLSLDRVLSSFRVFLGADAVLVDSDSSVHPFVDSPGLAERSAPAFGRHAGYAEAVDAQTPDQIANRPCTGFTAAALSGSHLSSRRGLAAPPVRLVAAKAASRKSTDIRYWLAPESLSGCPRPSLLVQVQGEPAPDPQVGVRLLDLLQSRPGIILSGLCCGTVDRDREKQRVCDDAAPLVSKINETLQAIHPGLILGNLLRVDALSDTRASILQPSLEADRDDYTRLLLQTAQDLLIGQSSFNDEAADAALRRAPSIPSCLGVDDVLAAWNVWDAAAAFADAKACDISVGHHNSTYTLRDLSRLGV
jgi:hypothetical protein